MASTTSKSLQQEIYKPKHPLPEELQKLDHDETVCQFCGVSYLIHNEIKRLEDELEKYKLKLNSYEGYDQREADLKRTIEEKDKELKKVNEEFKSAISRQNELMQNLDESNHLLETAKTEITKLKRELQKKEDDVNMSIKRTQQFHLSLTSLLEEVSEIRKSSEQVKQEYSGIKDLMKTGFSSAKQSMKEHIEIYGCYKEKIELQRIQATKELDVAKKELETLKANLLKSDEEIATGKEAKRDLEKSQKTIEGQKSDLAKIGSERDALSDALTKMKVMLSERGRKVDSLESAIQEKDRTAKEARSLHEKTIEKFKLELDAVNKKCQEHQREIETVKQSSKDEKEAMSATAIQLKVLKESLDASRNEISTLKKERQDMIDAHHNRIQQLRESFNEKISEANLWPKKLEEKLTEQQLRFNEEKTELWQQLTKSFEKEMQDLSARHQQEKQQMESKENNLKTKLKEQLETLQRRSREEIENLKANLDKEKEKNSKIIQSQESLIQNLDHKVQHLESRLANTQKKSSDDFGVYKQKYSEAQKMMELMKTEQKNLEKELNEKQKEIDVLQDTVRRECEERFDLTEALSEARLQLLANNRQTTRNRSAPDREMVPSPPMSSTERGRRDFKRRLKLTESKEKDRTDMSGLNLNRSIDNNGVTYDKVKESLDEGYNRKRIADAVAKQRASSRTGFNKLL